MPSNRQWRSQPHRALGTALFALSLLALPLTASYAASPSAAPPTVTPAPINVQVRDAQGKPLATVMVSREPVQAVAVDTSDNHYPKSGVLQNPAVTETRFTNAAGQVQLAPAPQAWKIRLRKIGYQDVTVPAAQATQPITMTAEKDPAKLAAQQPASSWAATIPYDNPQQKKEFLMHCNFCHQQGAAPLRVERSEEEWAATIKRMMRYGSRLSSEEQKRMPEILSKHWKDMSAHPEKVPAGAPWVSTLSSSVIREVPIGDAMSQMHDQLLHSNGMVYVGDNLQDRMYEVNPKTGQYTVYKLPPQPGDALGGLIGGRLKDFPRHEAYQGIHSMAESNKDGHIFITPSGQRRLVEFDPVSKKFTAHEMTGDAAQGFYPHTIRVDAQDRVWFTLALSNQVAMFNRTTQQFTLYDLPFRSLMEKLTVKLTPLIFKLSSWGLNIASWVKVDHVSTGVPLPYGIDITPDGKVWAARLHTQEIVEIDPAADGGKGSVTMIPTPFQGPRRLRSDSDGNLWIVAFNESKIAKYEPATKKFTLYDLPIQPAGNDTPYALNVDKVRQQVWITGTSSDSLYRYDIASGAWTVYPMPKHVTFTRDIEIGKDGKVYTSSASFPSWHIEDVQPTLIELTP